MLTKLTKIKIEKTQIKKIRNEMELLQQIPMKSRDPIGITWKDTFHQTEKSKEMD